MKKILVGVFVLLAMIVVIPKTTQAFKVTLLSSTGLCNADGSGSCSGYSVTCQFSTSWGLSFTRTYSRSTNDCPSTPLGGGSNSPVQVGDNVKIGTDVKLGDVKVTKNISKGSKGLDVGSLQLLLNHWGYLNTNATGNFGQMTVLAVRAFQKENGIAQTGSIGPKTRAAIEVKQKAEINASTTTTTASAQ